MRFSLRVASGAFAIMFGLPMAHVAAQAPADGSSGSSNSTSGAENSARKISDELDTGYVPRGCTTEEQDINADCRSGIRPPAKPARLAAPFDLSDFWISLIVEEWRWRMITPPKGDYASMPLNAAARKVADTWDPNAGDTCKAFGAAGLIRNPMRIRFEWEGDKILHMSTDHGSQKRTFYFDPADVPTRPPSMQGDSIASWEDGALKVVTTRLTPGYLRKNGVPYSDKTVLTEYFARYSAFDQNWLIVMTIVNDPTYLTREFITTTDFKMLKDGSEWHPTDCATEGRPASTLQ